jgi:hypothetical protein
VQIAGRCWRVAVSGLRPDEVRRMLAHVDSTVGCGVPPEGSIPIVARLPTEELAWPLELPPNEEVHCRRDASLNLYFSDGCLCICERAAFVDCLVPKTCRRSRSQVLSAAVLYSLARQGTLVFHAAGLGFGCSALLVLGESGSGKSSLAAAWLRSRRIMSDDAVVVSLCGDGVPIAEGYRADVLLCNDVVDMLPGALRGSLQDGSSRMGAKRVLMRSRNPSLFLSSARVAALVILHPGSRPIRSRVQPASQAEGLSALVGSNTYLGAGRSFVAKDLWAAAFALAASTPVLRLAVGTRLLDDPDAEVERICELVDDELAVVQPRFPLDLASVVLEGCEP